MDPSTQQPSDEHNWLDVQPTLAAVADQLQHGEMLQSEHFNLFEAMSAVEIGDPKMDAGLDTATAPTADQLVEQGLAPTELGFPQLIATLDHLAAMQASWHAGNSLAQTVFVCLYMLKPDRQANLQLSTAVTLNNLTVLYLMTFLTHAAEQDNIRCCHPTVKQHVLAVRQSGILSCMPLYAR